MATAALVLAASGGAYAATQLPRNSVGSKQLTRNAVRSSKVKNGSLLSRDFKAGQLPAGAQGSPGPQGLKGEKGEKGDNGDRGPSDAFNETSPFGQLRNLPAGSYAISERVEMSGGTGLASLRCALVANSTTAGGPSTTLDQSQTSASTASGTTDLVLPLQALATFSEPQTLISNCRGSSAGGFPSLSNFRLSAVQVDAIH